MLLSTYNHNHISSNSPQTTNNMSSTKLSPLVAALMSAATVAAHGHVDHIVIDGVNYQGYDPTTFPYQDNPPVVIGWTTGQADNGFVEPNSFGSADIICHKSASPGGATAQVKAGSSIAVTWNTWPESHKGPMIDYLASCKGSCETVDPASLEFFKIAEVGLIDDSVTNGFWGSDQLMKDGNTWNVQIPANIAPGNYVLRHETISLHSAGEVNGAQAYPQCFNLEVTGSGTEVPAGVVGTKLYTANDPGILVNIYTTGLQYTIPGPALISGAGIAARDPQQGNDTSPAEEPPVIEIPAGETNGTEFAAAEQTTVIVGPAATGTTIAGRAPQESLSVIIEGAVPTTLTTLTRTVNTPTTTDNTEDDPPINTEDTTKTAIAATIDEPQPTNDQPPRTDGLLAATGGQNQPTNGFAAATIGVPQPTNDQPQPTVGLLATDGQNEPTGGFAATATTLQPVVTAVTTAI